ncbi:mitochondrial glycoprotein [Exophiala viscosa]|uniref:mitochondrial glycoprotein n=1 Tax=Exophiala viscosa TaxID=2486360 RepID=UPI00219FEDC0|nr:mitochondrial glycoprotein [Exophiala viscosa]
MMNSFRLFPRALSKAALRQSSVRCASTASRFAARRPVRQPAMKSSYPAFSTSTLHREPAGEFDLELVEKLKSERSLELENPEEGKKEAIDEFLANNSWQLLDKEGTHEVTLTKEFGNEKIKVALSIADFDNLADEDEYDGIEEDGALDDEAEYRPKAINQSGAKGGKFDIKPEDSIAPVDREGDEGAMMDDGAGPAYPLHLTITITKPNSQAIEIRAVTTENVEIETITFFAKDSLVEAQNPKDAQEARSVYAGPPIGNLDPDLQAMLERYLEERGIDAQLAQFLPTYVDYKEQREYVKWLGDVKSFVEA